MYDSLPASGSLMDINIDKSMLQFVRNAHGRYQEALECKQKAATKEDKKISATRRASNQIKKIRWKGRNS
jgi:hypothetical protein